MLVGLEFHALLHPKQMLLDRIQNQAAGIQPTEAILSVAVIPKYQGGRPYNSSNGDFPSDACQLVLY
jgi:hypothetical protein